MNDCRNCKKKTKIVTDWSSGDTICTNCGMVLDERLISENMSEYRIFADDNNTSSSKTRVGKTQSIFESNISSEFQPDVDEREFYTKGLELMNDFFVSHFSDSREKAIEYRAREIFDHAFRTQKGEKLGLFLSTANIRLKNSQNPQTSKELTTLSGNRKIHVQTKRKKYSRKKTLIVAAIWIAFMEKGFSQNMWSVKHISSFFGPPVSETRVKNSLKLINLDMDSIRRTAQKRARERRRTRSTPRFLKSLCV